MNTLKRLRERCQQWKTGDGKYPAAYEAEEIEKLLAVVDAVADTLSIETPLAILDAIAALDEAAIEKDVEG